LGEESPCPSSTLSICSPWPSTGSGPADWRGQLHLLDGDPGLGKSLVLLDLAARLTTGRPFPDGAPPVAPSAAVILNAEDGARSTIRPRLQAAGADLSRVAIFDRLQGEAEIRLPSQVGLLEEVIRRKQASLVVIDPLLAFLDPGVNICHDPSVRRALAPLADLAAACQCAIILLRHLSKAAGTRALYRGLASIAFIAACRIAWLIGRDPKVPDQFVLSLVKNNLEQVPPSLAYRIVAAADAAQVCWLGVTAWTDADLVAANPARLRHTSRAVQFLTTCLEAGPRRQREVCAAARQQGIGLRSLRRAARELKITYRASASRTPTPPTGCSRARSSPNICAPRSPPRSRPTSTASRPNSRPPPGRPAPRRRPPRRPAAAPLPTPADATDSENHGNPQENNDA
jgi:hypothetical protein